MQNMLGIISENSLSDFSSGSKILSEMFNYLIQDIEELEKKTSDVLFYLSLRACMHMREHNKILIWELFMTKHK